MSRITPENMTTLQTAAAVKTVAASAVSELEEMQVAHCINEAANTGEYSATYCRPISAALKTKLESKGYTLTYPTLMAKSEDETIISWKDAE